MDAETRSTVDLKACGPFVYAAHPDTDVWMVCWALDEGPIETWWPGTPVPPEIVDHVSNGRTVVAHNFAFEQVISNGVLEKRYGWPHLRPEQGECTAAEAAAMALPRALEQAAAAAGLRTGKDLEGRRLMLKMCRPRRIEDDGTIVWWDDIDLQLRLAAYCETDVEVERQLHKRIQRLRPTERRVFQLDNLMNRRGVHVDMDLVLAAQKMAVRIQNRLHGEICDATRGEVTKTTQVAKLLDWVHRRGVETENLDKYAIPLVLADPATPDDVRTALEIRLEAAKSSTSKFKAFVDRTSADSRLRDNLMYHGASTGRWSGKGVQLQNLFRPVLKGHQIEQAIEDVLTGSVEMLEMFYPSPMAVLSDLVRACIVSRPGYDLVFADFNAIEARVLAWLAGQEDLLHLFRTDGDAYLAMAGEIFGVDPASMSKETHESERKLGKTAVLGCFGAKTLVLTDRGPLPIVDVAKGDRVWDGVEWVETEGPIAQGRRSALVWRGVDVTPEHLILTPRGWLQASQVASASAVFQRSVSDMAVSSLQGSRAALGAESAPSGSCATAAPLSTKSMSVISGSEAQEGATLARSARPAAHRSTTGGTPTSSRTRGTAPGCSIAYRLSSDAATDPAIQRTPAMEDGGYAFGARGSGRVESSSHTLSPSRGGTHPRSSSTGRTTTEATSPETCDSSTERPTSPTAEQSTGSSSESMSWRLKLPVYDLLNCGPRHRFTILTDQGPVIVHNCGYGMGRPKFRATCAKDRVYITQDLADQSVDAYRRKNDRVVSYWYAIEEAAVRAVRDGGVQQCRNIAFQVNGSFLRCRLPSGRMLYYAQPKFGEFEGRVACLSFMGVNSLTKKWERQVTYGGRLVENITQAVARDLLAEALLRLEDAGYPEVCSVHDEGISEVPEGEGSLDEYIAIMSQVPLWAEGCPVRAEGWRVKRYRK